MAFRDRSLREQLERRLLALDAKLPTSSLGRLTRTAAAGLRGARFALRGKDAGTIAQDVESLVALAASVGQLKGVDMKAGQLMSYLELELPPELKSALAVLQTHSPPMPFERVVEIVTKELGVHARPLLAHMNALPVAAASIGQVHRSRLPTGEDVIRSFYGPMLRDETLTIEPGAAKPLAAVVASKRELLKLRLPGEFVFILCIRFGVMSVLAQLGARANWYELERGYTENVLSF